VEEEGSEVVVVGEDLTLFNRGADRDETPVYI